MGDAKLLRSMSRKGCSPDNAACEGFFSRLKTELFYPRKWPATTIEQFIQMLDFYIRWYNEKGIKKVEAPTHVSTPRFETATADYEKRSARGW